MACAIQEASSEIIEWFEFISDPNGKLIYDSQSNSMKDNNYTVDRTTSDGISRFQLNLRHGSLTKEKAGTYGCGIRGESVSKAEFIYLGITQFT